MHTPPRKDTNARAEWEQHIGQRTGEEGQARPSSPALPAPAGLWSESGAGKVTLRWQPVEGAVGYLVHRSESPDGPFERIDHGGGDVLAVPGPPYCDTTGIPGTRYWYAVAALSDVKSPPDHLSEPVEAMPRTEPAQPIQMNIKASTPAGQLHPAWHMLGSEHLSQLFYTEKTGEQPIGEDFQQALILARDELGVSHIRAHAILNDEQGVYREINGEASYDFTAIDRIFGRLLSLNLRPIVELSFMPRDLASNPEATVFTYRGIISPPRDWQRWGKLNVRLAEHLVQRYGIDEVSRWGFEVWNEPDLKVFWTGTQQEYFHLYDVAARAIKSVDHRLLVGGPSTAAAEWVADFLRFVREQQSPLDFVSTHTYGNYPLDIGQALKTYGFAGKRIWWTEWGVTPTHFAPVNDSAFAAPFVLHGMKSVQGRADALDYWVVSDHFEELGRPPRLLHGGFGLLTVGNLRKPRYYALALAERLGRDLVQLDLQGDGAGSLVDAWATRKPDGSLHILAWNGTLDQSKMAGDPLLNRRLDIRIEQLEDRPYHCTVARVDAIHSNIVNHWNAEDGWPTREQWSRLRELDRLDEETLPDVVPVDGVVQMEFELPMPGVVEIRMEPM